MSSLRTRVDRLEQLANVQHLGGLTISASAPSGSGKTNDIWVCTTGGSKGVYVYNGTSWVLVAS